MVTPTRCKVSDEAREIEITKKVLKVCHPFFSWAIITASATKSAFPFFKQLLALNK
jgi:hypothetical protein